MSLARKVIGGFLAFMALFGLVGLLFGLSNVVAWRAYRSLPALSCAEPGLRPGGAHVRVEGCYLIGELPWARDPGGAFLIPVVADPEVDRVPALFVRAEGASAELGAMFVEGHFSARVLDGSIEYPGASGPIPIVEPLPMRRGDLGVGGCFVIAAASAWIVAFAIFTVFTLRRRRAEQGARRAT